MWNFYDIAYGLGVGIAAPVWLLSPAKRKKVGNAFRQRMGEDIPPRIGDRPAILIHAVSVGEMNATRALVSTLRTLRPDLDFIVSATTDTGFARGQELYPPANGATLIRYPLDFSSAINRVLDAVRPDLVVLMELEVWPNFVKHCQDRDIPVILANARLTDPSFRKYQLAGPITRKMFRRLALVCAQDMTYAQRFLELGVPHHRVVITGTMKFDNAKPIATPDASQNLARVTGFRPEIERLWVAGSTGPGEEEIILNVYRKLLLRHPRLRLAIIPRHPPRFDEVADLIQDFRFQIVRRTAPQIPTNNPPIPPVILGDTMGELRDFYSIADVVFVGRTLVDLGPRQHGSDMIEPAALARPTVVGPFTGNFAEAMRKFRESDAMLVVPDAEALEQTVGVLLSTPAESAAMGRRAADVVKREQGATMRHARVILQILSAKLDEEPLAPPSTGRRPAAPGITITHIGPPAPFASGEVRIEPPR